MIIILIITIMLMMIVIILKIIIILIVTIMLIMIVLILKIIMIIIIILIITIIGFSSGQFARNGSSLSTLSRSIWNLEVGFLWGRQNRRTQRKPRSKVENQHVTQPTCDVRSRN